jgi:hypothetical protein
MLTSQGGEFVMLTSHITASLKMFATLEEKNLEFSPWGKLICDQFMDKWWPDVTKDGKKLAQHRDDSIHSYGTVPYPVPADWKPEIKTIR